MECFYINLDSEKSRRDCLESNFQKHKRPAWNLHRFAAVDAEYVKKNKIPGSIRPEEKGCFISHRDLIQSTVNNAESVMVMEDDAIIGADTCAIIDSFMANHAGDDWDILFTDVFIDRLATWVLLLEMRNKLKKTNAFKLLDVNDVDAWSVGTNRQFVAGDLWCAGSTSYIINRHAKAKIYKLLLAKKALDLPYDLYLQRQIHKFKVKALVIFPFITSLSKFSSPSSIQADTPRLALTNLFRKMIWIGAELSEHKPTLKQIEDHLADEEAKMFAVLFSAMLQSSS